MASLSGGAISSVGSDIMLTGSCTVYFNNNWSRQYGGAVHMTIAGYFICAEGSTVEFFNNTALLSGGALSSLDRSTIWFTQTSRIFFTNNLGREDVVVL